MQSTPTHQPDGTLDQFGVGRLVASSTGLSLFSQIQHDLCAQPRMLTSAWFQPVGAGPQTQTFYIPFRRHPYMDSILLSTRCHPPVNTWGSNVGAPQRQDLRYVKLAAHLNGYTSSSYGPFLSTISSGSVFTNINTHIGSKDDPRQEWFTANIDVTSVPVNSISFLSMSYTATQDRGNGIAEVVLEEVPRPSSDPVADPAAEPGVSIAWPFYPNRIIEGSDSTSTGWARVIGELDQAKHIGANAWWLDYNENNRFQTTLGSMELLGPPTYFPLRSLYEQPGTEQRYVTVWACATAPSGGTVRVYFPSNGPTSIDVTIPASATPVTASAGAYVPVTAYDEWAPIWLGGNSTNMTIHSVGVFDDL